MEKFGVYLMDEKGRYPEPEWLPAKEAVLKARHEKDNHYEIRVTDTGDCLVLHIVEGKLLFPVQNGGS